MNDFNRDMVFGRMFAIANVLGQRVFGKDKQGIAEKYMARFSNNPASTFKKIHEELLGYSHTFDESEKYLLEMLQEQIYLMSLSDYTNEPLTGKYLYGYHTKQHELNNVIGVEEASELWGLSPGTIKNYCAEGKIEAKKIGKTWVINKNQTHPSKTKELKSND